MRAHRFVHLAVALVATAACSLDGGGGRTSGAGGGGGGSPGQGTDADGDGISDFDEGADAERNTDGDEFPDYLDLDSDGDGLADAEEAGDADLATAPRDTDGDGTPDFVSTDSDGDGISDTDELDRDFRPVDTDGDGSADHLDEDADGDTIRDSQEGLSDPDGDGVPNFRDLDSDGDCIPDRDEAGDGDPATPPRNSGGDPAPDFLSLDADGDFIPDEEEDASCDGVVDPGESSSTSADTDGDGIPDLIEVLGGGDAGDPDVGIPAGDFYFVLPYEGPEADGPLDFTTSVRSADVFFSVDTTGSFGEEIAAIRESLEETIVPGIADVIPDVAFGVGRFEDLPHEPFGLPGDQPFELLQAVTADVDAVGDGLALLPPASGGLDTPESGYEALYQWASGSGLPEFELPPFAPPGIGGVGFRADALPIIVHIGDARSHLPEDYATLTSGAHGRDDAVEALVAIGARVIGVDSLENVGTPNDPREQMEDMAIATRAVIPPDPDSGDCLTGVDGAPRDPVEVEGELVCPVVFDVAPDGTGLGPLIVDAVVQLATLGTLDVSTRPVGETQGLQGEQMPPGFTTADFIQSITPIAPPPEGAEIEGDVFLHVTPGSAVAFQVVGFNDFQEHTTRDQLFAADVEVLGDAVTLLDVRRVFIIVPREIPEGPL